MTLSSAQLLAAGIPEDIALLEGIQASRFLGLVSFTVLYFDYAIMFSTEVERFWKKFTWTWVSALFVSNRYVSLLGSIPVILDYVGDMSEVRCRRLWNFHEYYSVILHVTATAILLIRTYALYGRSRRILALLLTAAVAGCIVAIWAMVGVGVARAKAEPIMLLYSGCGLSTPEGEGRWLAGIAGCILVIDTLVFALTVLRAVQSNGLWRAGLLRIMLFDGAAYYGALAVLGAVVIVTSSLPLPTIKAIGVSLANTISSILICRLMLNIRNPKAQIFIGPSRSLGTSEIGASEIHFAPFVSEASNGVLPSHCH